MTPVWITVLVFGTVAFVHSCFTNRSPREDNIPMNAERKWLFNRLERLERDRLDEEHS